MSSHQARTRKGLLSRASRLSLPLVEKRSEAEKRQSAIESYRLVSSIGQGNEGDGWEVEVARTLVVQCLGYRGLPEKEIGEACGPNIIPVTPPVGSSLDGSVPQDKSLLLLPDTHQSCMSPVHIRDAKILHRAPFTSLLNTLSTMSNDNVTPPALPASDAHDSARTSTDKGKGRPIITPSSLSRRTAATTRSFSSLQPPKLSTSNTTPAQSGSTLPSLLAPPKLAVIAPTPEASPITPSRRGHHKSVPETPSSDLRVGLPSAPPVQKSYSSGSAGKRKAEEADVDPGSTTPPKEQKEHRATFAPEPRTHRGSASSHAPSSYRRKRARLSLPSESAAGSSPPSRPPSSAAMGSVAESANAKSTGSWSSRRSGNAGPVAEHQVHRQATGATTASTNTHSRSNSQSQQHGHSVYQHQPAPSRRSLSQASMPLSALISPHAPSVVHSGSFHMRDPRKPAPTQSTPWSLSFPSRVESGHSRWKLRGWVERGGSPLHAWFFFIGFVLFPVWWVTSFVGVPRTRRLGAGGVEKGVVLDDPQVEYDARSWRTRCRVMAVISLFTYIPFIILIIIFAR